MPEPIVSLQHVVKEYRANWSGSVKTALSDIDLEIFPGESVGFIGHNGAGKSTTIRIILGLQRPTAGSVRLRGLDVTDPDSRRRVSYLPENPLLYDYLTPLELLEMGARMHDLVVPDLRGHCLKWLDRFGIATVASRPIKTFSKGMMQRTALAHALCCEPEFLILDEPLSGLDPIGRREVVEILEEYRGAGRTLFFSSHVLFDVERLADRFVFIHEGKIRAVGSPDELLSTGAANYEVLIEGSAGLDGFIMISARLWSRTVSEAALPELLREIANSGGQFRLHSLHNVNSLEKAYLKFVQAATS
jgi:ABC-2 type transport system ATP-binding protein